MKKVLAFDLDKTLTDSKTPVDNRMVEILSKILDKFQVCVISGCSYDQFHKQLLSSLKLDTTKLQSLHIMPTCGTRYYTYNLADKGWHEMYAENLTEVEKSKISEALLKCFKDLGYGDEQTWGELVEDRLSQVTLSTLGQEAPLNKKEAWDPTNTKKQAISDNAAKLLPEFEVKVGGLTSIDVTKPGIDKAYGMKKLIDALGIAKEDILFFGDRVQEGGNDYPVKAMGIDTLEVSDWKDTAIALETVLHVL